MLSTITVNYKTVDFLERMLESLFAHHLLGDIEVIVVENGSGDDLTLIEDHFPSVKIIKSQKNLGFAGGCNLGIREAHGEFVVLLNPDILFTEPALDKIADAMRTNPSVGIGGISLKNFDGTQQKCVWSYPTPSDQLLVLLKIHHLLPWIGSIKRWRMDGFSYQQSADVDQVMGAFFCIRRTVIEQIGLLDERFFVWYEEVDFCQRTTNAGWRVRYFANISAQHKIGSSFDRVPTIRKQQMLRRSVRVYIKKHFGNGWGFLFWMLEPVFFVCSLLTSLLKPI